MCSVSVEVENVPDIGNSLPPPLLIANVVKGAGDQFFLAVLDRHHLLLNRVLGDELVDEDVPVLTHPVDPVEALPLTRGVPGRVQQQEVVGRGQVETNSSCLRSYTKGKDYNNIEIRGKSGKTYLQTQEKYFRRQFPTSLEHFHHI